MIEVGCCTIIRVGQAVFTLTRATGNLGGGEGDATLWQESGETGSCWSLSPCLTELEPDGEVDEEG